MGNNETFNSRILRCYLSVHMATAKRLIGTNSEQYVWMRFLEEYFSLLSETGKLPPNRCLTLNEPVYISSWNKTVTFLFMGSELKAGFKEMGSENVSELDYSVIRKITESVMDQMEDSL